MKFSEINLICANCSTNICKKQYLCLFNSFTKNDWICELTNVKSHVYDFLKEEAEKLFFSTGGYLKYLDFDSCYVLAVDTTSRQVRKNIKKNKKYFFENQNNNLLIYKKIKERLVSNLRNLFDSKRKINILDINLSLMDKIYENYEIDTTIRDLQKLAISNPQIIIDNVKKLANNFELSTIEIEELGEKLNMNFTNLIELDLSLFENLKKDVNNQTFFIFKTEEEAA